MLLLFDIDGTLVAGATEAHRKALHEALREVHGVAAARVRSSLAPAGRTDGEIARAILLAAGVSAETIDERADAVREACSRAYVRLATDDLSHTVIPGIKSLLAWLCERDDVNLGLVTGNFEAVGRLKLERAGLGGYFASAVGAFGSDSEDRAALPGLARRRAGRPGRPYPRAQTVVIGDTPRDIACARADELSCVAVTTGPFDREALADADAVFDDAHGLREWLARRLATG
ncbi:MAG: haloacid dehalogenase-like hydrolase [Solirubrobacterales bacterium]|nr:haloacid dehalogenase-like hydrolase [Solirubrobacterales bacterium]